MKNNVLVIFISLWMCFVRGQQVPAIEENIPYLVTFGKNSAPSWGDKDFSQTFFFVIPPTQIDPIYIRVYDPDTGNGIDELKGPANTSTTFSVYGGKECISNKDARKNEPSGNYKSGTLLGSKTFNLSEKYNSSWYTFGPFNPKEGELVQEYGGYVFKIIAEGGTGDDGNLYKYFLSTIQNDNKAVEGSNCFTFEYTFRLSDNQNDVSHLYPYIDNKVISIKISNFDFDNDGNIKIVSAARRGEIVKISGENNWVTTEHKINDEERNSSLDIQFIKSKAAAIKNNNITLFITNQYGEMLPFYVVPIGGIPKFKYKIAVRPK